VYTEFSKKPYQVFSSNVSHLLGFVSAGQVMDLTLTLTFPEGVTRDVSVEISVTPGPMGDPDLFSITLESSDIHPMTERCVCPLIAK